MIGIAIGKQWRRFLAVTLASVHLAVVTFFAFIPDVDDWEVTLQSRVGFARSMVEAVLLYASWSGTGTSYSYFAPGVSLLPRIRFRIMHASGEVTDYIVGVDQFEIELRAAPLAATALRSESPALFARSLAALAFDQQDDAQRVTVIFDELIFPSIGEALNGQEVAWAPAFSADFIRNGNELICQC